jgi:hypothetical protein
MYNSESWISPFRTFGMNLDTSWLVGIISKNIKTSKEDGYITPPLTSPRPSGHGSTKRIGVVTILILMLLYFIGFRVPGFRWGNKKVVIILAANIGGGIIIGYRI